MVLLRRVWQYLTRRPMVRPWALASPILVLLVCLPMLRPLRHPDPRDVSDDELARLATVQAIVQSGSLALVDPFDMPASHLVRSGDQVYSDQPPVMAMLLSGPYWLLTRFGITYASNPNLVAYVLTLLGSTLPVALAAGLIYRMSRLFELRRPARMLLGAAVVFGSGLVSYGVVLNAHAPAAVLVLASAAFLIRVAVSDRPSVGGGWIIGAGFAAALAMVIEPAAVIFAALFAVVPIAMRWSPSLKVGGVLLYLIGMLPPVFLHTAIMMTEPVTGDLLPGMFHPELAVAPEVEPLPLTGGPISVVVGATTTAADGEEFTGGDAPASWFERATRPVAQVLASLLGPHGLLSHFPILIFGVLGIGAIMHRHWPTSTKVLASATVVGAAIVVLVLSLATPAGTGSMFAARWFVVFVPLLLFWAGAWVRRPHHATTWTLAGILLAFSVTITMLGATNPFPRHGYDRYTAVEALSNLRQDASAEETIPMLAGGANGRAVP